MRNGKKTLTIITIVIILLVASLAGAAYAYFFTDVFKSDKQKFFKYMAKNIESASTFKSVELTNYLEKKGSQPYENSGEFYTTIDEKTASSYMPNKKLYDEVEKFKILFQGQKDISNGYFHEAVSLQYSNGEKMTFELAKQEDYYGIKVDTILKKYLALENNNLKEFAKNIGIQDTSVIPDKIEFKNYDKYKFTDDEIKNIQNKIYKVLNENLQDTMFREEKNDSYQKYILTLTKGQVEEILYKLYNTLVNDEVIINKIKIIATEELKMTEQEIDEKIEQLKKEADSYLEKGEDTFIGDDTQSKDTDTDLISINVYNDKAQKGNIPSIEIVDEEFKISLGLSDNRLTLKLDEGEKDGETIVYNPIGTISLDKVIESTDLTYSFNASVNGLINTEFTGKMKFAGILSEQDSVKEELTIGIELGSIEDSSKMQYTYLNNVKFKDNISKEDLKLNSTIINNYNAQKLQTTLEKLTSLIDLLNKKQMQSIGLQPDQNPVLYMTPFLSPFMGQNNVLEKTATAMSKENEGRAKENVELFIFSLRVKFYAGNLDEYINEKLSSESNIRELNKQLETCGYTASYDKNIGLILSTKDSAETLIAKIENGDVIWNK